MESSLGDTLMARAPAEKLLNQLQLCLYVHDTYRVCEGRAWRMRHTSLRVEVLTHALHYLAR